MLSLENKVAVVLGGASGIGKAIALGYAKAGADVVVSSRRKDMVEETAGELRKLGSKTLVRTSDVTDRTSLETFCQAVVDEFGRVDILAVTSGILIKCPTAEMAEADWQRVIDTNLTGTFRANQIFGRQMIRQKQGVILNTGSMTSFVAFSEVAAYNASKSGVRMLTETLAVEWAPHNIRVNAIAPGVFRTSLNARALDIPERLEAIIRRTPMGRIGSLDELVGAAVFLVSDEAAFITGVTLPVDGGFLAKGI
ncbi:MAG TPA: glucose 1-dehydrogenase [Bryobacterales bacterium]|jgi:NAD(P)-dependent dehydrogenase (short-subunit alcohol dehydrogenase family)|nr:glucose 1-dehydrogenase [Bryobacterales bacterium]